MEGCLLISIQFILKLITPKFRPTLNAIAVVTKLLNPSGEARWAVGKPLRDQIARAKNFLTEGAIGILHLKHNS